MAANRVNRRVAAIGTMVRREAHKATGWLRPGPQIVPLVLPAMKRGVYEIGMTKIEIIKPTNGNTHPLIGRLVDTIATYE